MLPKPVTLEIVPFEKPFGIGFLYIAAFKGNEHCGPYGRGESAREAINNLVDNTETLMAAGAL